MTPTAYPTLEGLDKRAKAEALMAYWRTVIAPSLSTLTYLRLEIENYKRMLFNLDCWQADSSSVLGESYEALIEGRRAKHQEVFETLIAGEATVEKQLRDDVNYTLNDLHELACDVSTMMDDVEAVGLKL